MPAVFVATLALVAAVYLFLDFHRTRAETLDRYRAQATAVAHWVERTLDRTASTVRTVAGQGADVCAPGGMDSLAMHLRALPVIALQVRDGARVACGWRAPSAAARADDLCAAQNSGQTVDLPVSLDGGRRMVASVDAGCLLNAVVIGDESLGVVVRLLRREAAEAEPADRPSGSFWSGGTEVVVPASSWPVSVGVGVPETAILRTWAAALPLQSSLIAGLGLALWFGPMAFVRRHLSVEGQVRSALRRGDFFLAYLPTVELPSQDWIGVEALLRWRHARHGVLMPNAFIPWIEQSPLIYDTTRWVMVQAGKDLARMVRHQPEFSMAINVPPSQLSDVRLVDMAREAFGDHPLALCRVVFELTERDMGDYTSSVVREVVAALKARGAQFALDDFGVGFSNLSCLQFVEIDYLKIDRSFLQEWEQSGIGPNILEGIVRLARELGVALIAEGIETERQLDRIRRNGIILAQGFLFSRPIEVDTVLSQLQGRRRNAAAGRA